MFLLLLWFFNTMDPGLKIAGVTNKGNRGIQGIHPFRHSRNLLSGIQRLLLREAFSPSVVFYFYAFVFSGGYEGACPLIVLFRHSRNLLSGIHVFAFFFGFSIPWTPA